jgi:MFS family permease
MMSIHARRISEEGKEVQKSTVGGILSIVAGALGLLGGLTFLLVTAFASSIFNGSFGFNDLASSEEQFLTVMVVMYAAMGIIGLILGALGIVGGVVSIQRKRWGWALAGAIASSLSFLPLGVAAIVLVAMARTEFIQDSTVVSV